MDSFEQYDTFNDNSRQILEDFFWLRFLELEQQLSQSKRGSVKIPKMGQSIFTVTKRLRKEEYDDEFGFESKIIWTKPCVIGGLIKDSPAEQSHLEPGDLIVFIDKKNIVNMNKSEILELIRQKDALTLEVFRRAHDKLNPLIQSPLKSTTTVQNHDPPKETPKKIQNSISVEERAEKIINIESERPKLQSKASTDSSGMSKRKQLVTFSQNESTATSVSVDSSQRSCGFVNTFLQCERQFIEALNFGYNRYILALKNRKDLLSTKEHEVLFKNIESIKSIMEKIYRRENLEQMIQAYKNNIQAFSEEYQKYFGTIRAADCIVVDKTHHPEFLKFIANPPVPSNQPLFHNFIQCPAEFYSNLQKNFRIMLSQYRIDCHEYKDLCQIIDQLKIAYGEAMIKANECAAEVKPLLFNLESRLVFTKCKPFKLDIPSRQWIFGGDLIRIEGNLSKPTYTLLFNDIILFSTINRDRVMFITEEPLPLKYVVETFFNIKKKENEFRLTVETNPNFKDNSPTTHCTPELIMSPLRQSKRRNIFLRAPTEEIKKVWQNLITQQVFNINNSPITNSINHVDPPNVSLLIKTPSTHIGNFPTSTSTNRNETENFCSPRHQLNLKSQNAFDFDDSVEDEDRLETPETPSCANISSLNGKIQKSLSSNTFTSVKNTNDCGESCENIFNDFDISFSNDVKECLFMQNDPFFADDS